MPVAVSRFAAPKAPAPIVRAPVDAYRPGVCNIGDWEIRRRRRFAILAFVISAVLLAVLVATGVPAVLRLLVLFPLWGAVFSWLQARRRFCAGFAVARISNFADGEAGRRSVTDDAAHRADLAAVRRMTRDSFLVALAITLVIVAALQAVRPA
jgi:hypothetical protein